MLPSLQIVLLPYSVAVISKLIIKVLALYFLAMLVTIFMPSTDLPTLGLAPITIKLPALNVPIMPSSLVKPVL